MAYFVIPVLAMIVTKTVELQIAKENVAKCWRESNVSDLLAFSVPIDLNAWTKRETAALPTVEGPTALESVLLFKRE